MRVAIIGGGAAGMMCTASVHEADPNADIFLIDRNDGLGKKVIISGGGRCNVTTGITDVKTVLTKYPRGGKFLISAMYAFPPEAVYEWFESHGVPLKKQIDMRVFPVSDNGHDIVGVFEKMFNDPKIHLMLKNTVVSVKKRGSEFEINIKDKDAPIVVDKLVLTTGGQAYRQTGSTGDGYAFATSLGHTITPLAPSLSAFFTKETWPAKISGLSFEKATITAKLEKHPHFTGPFLFTHKGISGPAVFALSSLIAYEKFDKLKPLKIYMDLFPDETLDGLKEKYESITTEKNNKQFVNIISHIVPKSLAEIIIDEQKISKSKRANQVSKKEIINCLAWIKSIPLSIIARSAGDEFVTAGGVKLSEIDPKTMESKICPGLYFAGEIMDVDGFTGGFNLQASWATGRQAGLHIAKNI
ncbi:MAG: hypothetical protein ACD_76C00109G0005 [uncultured bacterium]|nr:MAG: hypothetical protein ACD_76C00109G0005 [uncultured bacterium]HBD04929.1 hypothetical protein [Candidatus Uhrbacteria bacterium]